MGLAQTESPAAFGPIPSENQYRVLEMEQYAFVHFSLNTYTDQPWGYGNEDIKMFNPEKLDCRQWARVCKQAGMKGIIITAKHHCGFCLWPSKYTNYSVKNAPWKNGKGDVLREMAEACKEYGLKLGIYLSPWDRNNPDYGSPAYIQYFRNQLTELLTNYGPIFEVWFDGANGGDGYYGGANEVRKIDAKTYYDWDSTYKLVYKLQPQCVIWNDGGKRGDLRWVGTEAGFVGETNWSLLDSTGEVSWNMLHYGKENGNAWVQAEVNTSIRPEWFYHPAENSRVKSLPQLMELYYNSVGRNATMLLNFPIMPNGLIHEIDETKALELAKTVKKTFAINLVKNAKITTTNYRNFEKKFGAQNVSDENNNTYWATDEGITTASMNIDFGKPISCNRFLVQENIRLGQRVQSFSIEAFVNGGWKELAKGTTIGYKRIIRFTSINTSKLRFNITAAKASPLISTIGIYNAQQILEAPSITRNKWGEITITPADSESKIFYTFNGLSPTLQSIKYISPFVTEGKVDISALAFDPISQKTSSITHEKFDIVKKQWKVIGIADENANLIIDGNSHTVWHQAGNIKFPVDVIIDLGKEENLVGFKYLPDQTWWGGGQISQYQFFVSNDGIDWQLKSEGEFSNIKYNPLWQTKIIPSTKGRYIKLRALKNADNNNIGYSEIDIITK
jgi:alpha-L-fucosidase